MAVSEKKIGPYTVVERIGGGGMAEIFLAKQQGLAGFEKLVALKKILPQYSRNKTFAQLMIQEAKLAARIQHLNVVQVLDLGEFEDEVFIAMEFIRGRDLAALLTTAYRRRERLPVNISVEIAIEMLTGLDYAHRLQDENGQSLLLIHRDISPQNVMLSYEGEVKVTDFGIARILSPAEVELPGNLHGKFGYMSPEQVRGERIDQRSDIFSAGVVIYEMLSGRRLYRGGDPKATIKMILNTEVPPPSEHNPDVPEGLDTVVLKALAKDREERYRTVGSLIGDLARVAESIPRRASRRDIAVYMRRQFGVTSMRGGAQPTASDTSVAVSAYSPASGSRKPLGEVLIAAGALQAGDVELALAEQRARGGRIGEVLVLQGVITETQLLAALSTQSGVPVMDSAALESIEVNAGLVGRFPKEFLENAGIAPLSLSPDGETLSLAAADPFDQRSHLEAQMMLGVARTQVRITSRSAIRSWLSAHYAPKRAPSGVDIDIVVEEDVSPLVVIADADQEARESLAERIRQEEIEVLVFGNGKDARDLLREREPTVAFFDAALPGIDGYNLLLELRSKDSKAAIFVTSSRPDEFHESKALELGADDFLGKPHRVEAVTSKVRRELKKRTRLPEAPKTSGAVTGKLDEMPAIDIIQTLEIGRKTAEVTIQYDDGRTGCVAIVGGQIRAAKSNTKQAEAALFELVNAGPGSFRIAYQPPTLERNISRANTDLLLDALRMSDTRSRPSENAFPSVDLDISVEDSAPPSAPPSENPFQQLESTAFAAMDGEEVAIHRPSDPYVYPANEPLPGTPPSPPEARPTARAPTPANALAKVALNRVAAPDGPVRPRVVTPAPPASKRKAAPFGPGNDDES